MIEELNDRWFRQCRERGIVPPIGRELPPLPRAEAA